MWPNPQFPADLVKFTEEILNGKRHFLCSAILNSSASPYLNGLHTLLIKCLYMIDCLISVEDLYVFHNILLWTLLRIVICMHKDLLLSQPHSALDYFFPWFHQWSGTLTDRLSGAYDELKHLRNQAPNYSISWD